jgi:EmrB/QacA subfamily drug resistance transporter
VREENSMASADPTPAGRTEVEPAASPASPDRRWLALAVLLIGAFMDLLDGNIILVAAPTVQRDLHADYAVVQWIAVAYALAFAVMLIVGGRLGDIYGRKRMFLTGLAGFTVASALCAVAPDAGVLVVARLLQGTMAAVMVPQVLAIVHVTFSPRERGNVIGLYAAIGGLAIVAGPVLGGVLTSWSPFGLGWRAIFMVNLPVGVAAFVLAALLLRETTAQRAPSLDRWGAVLAVLGLALLFVPLLQGQTLGWPWWSVASMVLSVPVFGLFVVHEHRRTRAGRTPLVVLSLFRSRTYSAGVLAMLLMQCAPGAFFLTWMIYQQRGLGWSPLHSGLTTIPFSVGLAMSGALAGQVLYPRFGRRSIMAGIVLMMIGLAYYGVVAGQQGAGVTSWDAVVPFLCIGAGMGQIVAPLSAVALADVPPDDAGAASGVVNATMQLGGATGIALIGTVFFASIGTRTGAWLVVPFQESLWYMGGALLLTLVLTFAVPRNAVLMGGPE